jgi:hypothetical protein
MTSIVLSRRKAIAWFAGSAVLPLLAGQGALAQSGPRFRAIEVDVSGVRESGDVVSADRIARELPALLQTTFAGRLAPGDRRAPILRARIDFVTYGSNGSAGGPDPTVAIDSIEGAGIVVGSGGRPIASYPLRATLVAHPDFLDNTGVSERVRTYNLAQSFAYWLPGKMGV